MTDSQSHDAYTPFIRYRDGDLKLEVDYDDDDTQLKMSTPDTLDWLLQMSIDTATTSPSDLNGLIVLHASLRRWEAYARKAIKLLERNLARPGYLAEE